MIWICYVSANKRSLYLEIIATRWACDLVVDDEAENCPPLYEALRAVIEKKLMTHEHRKLGVRWRWSERR